MARSLVKHVIFYKKLLELVPLDTKLVIDIELKDNKYKIKEIKNL